MARRLFLLFAALVFVASSAFADIRATVMTIDGKPIADARVALLAPELPRERIARLLSEHPEPRILAESVTDSRGNATVVLPKGIGVATLQFERVGYGPAVVRAIDGEDVGAVVLPIAKTVEGRITLDGEPAAGAVVSWRGLRGSEIVVRSDEHGVYRVPDPKAWVTTERTILHPGAAVHRLALMPGTMSPHVNLDAGVTVSGRVVAEDGRTPVAGASISVDGWPRGTSGEDGTWTIAHVPGDWGSIEVASGSQSGVLTRGSKQNVVTLTRPATLAGTLIDGRSNRPVADAIVSLGRGGRLGGGDQRDAARTDAKGNYVFASIPAGNYQISIEHPAYAAEMARVAVKAASANTRNLVATPTATLAGSVVDEAKRPLAASRMESAEREQGRRFSFVFAGDNTAFSAPDGRFVLRGIAPEQSFDVRADKKGYPSTKEGPFELAPAQRKTGVLIVVPSGVRVEGTVADADGVPLADVSVLAVEASNAPMNPGMVRRMIRAFQREEDPVKTNAKGAFAVQLKEGKYDVSFRREGFAPKRVNGVEARIGAEPIEVTMEPGVELRGRVVRSDGRGVQDVLINVMAEGSGLDPIATGVDGSFTVPDLAPGAAMVLAVKPEEYIQEMRSVKIPGDDLVITLPATGRIEGRVTDKATGQPVTDFDVGPSGERGGGGMRVVMPMTSKSVHADDGYFLLENIPAGEVALVVNAPGFVNRTLHGLKVVEGETLENVEVALERGVKLTGKVTGPDGSPLEGVTVARASEDGGFRLPPMLRGGAAAVTDGSGEYTIEAVEPGEQTITFERTGYLPERKSVKLEGAEVRVDVRLSRGRDVRGVVVSEAGQPVEGAEVRARSSAQDSGWNSARSDGNGQFEFQGLVPGRYTFSAEKTGFVEAEARDIDIEAAGALRLVLGQGGVIAGRVLGLDANEYASVQVVAQAAGARSAATVDGSGSFRLEGAPTGSVQVSAMLRSMFDTRTTPVKVVEVAPGSEAMVDLEFGVDTVIRGRVTRSGEPLASALVNFAPRDRAIQTRGSTSTDANGDYEVTGLDDGLYDVAVIEMRGFAPYDTTWEVRGSGTFDIDIRGASVAGRVTDAESGDAIADATVKIERTASDTTARRFIFDTSRQTDPRGGFEFVDLPEGAYRVRAEATGYGHDIAELSVSEGSSRDVELRLLRNVGALVRIVDARDGRALGATLLVRDGQGRTAYQGSPSPRADGTLRIDVAPGSYQVSVFASDYATGSATVSSPAPAAVTIAVSPGGTVEIRSNESTMRSGRLTRPAGEPLMRNPYNVRGEFGIAPGLTRLENVPPGSWMLQILEAQGAVDKTMPVDVREGQVTSVEP